MNFHRKSLILIVSIALLTTIVIPSVFSQQITKQQPTNQEINPFLIKLSEDQLDQIHQYLLKIEDDSQRIECQHILYSIIENEAELNVVKLFDTLANYTINQIYHSSDTADLTDDLYMFIMTIIQERLGWTYDFFQKTSNLLDDAQRLWNDKGLPGEIINETKNLIEMLEELQLLLIPLIQKEYAIFLKEWTPGILVEHITSIISSIETLANDLGILIGDIQRMIYDTTDFVQWILDEPWKQPIGIYGSVMIGLRPIENATITCHGISTTSDSEGYFEFVVDTIPLETSIPANSYYGLHQCIIQVSYNNQSISTPGILSYVFSDGAIYWFFLLKDSNSNHNQAQSYFHEQVSLLKEKTLGFPILHHLLSLITKRIHV